MAKQDALVQLFYNGVWNTVGAYTDTPIRITCGRTEGAEPTPKATTLALAGFHNPKSPLSQFYGLAGQNTPLRVRVDSTVRSYGELASWDPQRTVDHNPATGRGKAWTDVSASGVLRRIGQGADPLRSALFRSMSGTTSGDYVPHAYWPMEDGKESTQFANAVGGAPGIPVSFAGIDDPVLPANDDSMPGSEPVPTLPTNTYIEFTVAPYTDTGQVVHQVAMHLTDEFALGALIVYAEDLEIQAQVHPTGLFVQAAPISTGVPIFTNFALYDPSAVVDRGVSLIVASVDTGGGDTLIVRVLDDQGATIGQTLDINPGVYRRVDRVRIASFDTGAVGTGHYAIFLDPNFTAATDGTEGARAIGGWAGERAGDRFFRLCQEEGIANSTIGDAADTPPMGPQPRETLAALFAEIERTDDGILFESVTSAALRYRTRWDLYNQDPRLVLDYAANEVAPPLDLIVDDLSSRNDVTVARRGGSEARAVLEDGPLSVQEPPDGIGRYSTKVDVNTETDDVLTDHAWWHLSKGTVNGARYDRVTVDLVAAPGLVSDVEAVGIGDVIALDNLPSDEATGRVRLLVLGYTETIESHRRKITFNCVPADPYDVAVYGVDPSGIVSRYGASETTLATAVDETDTAWTVDPSADVWPTSTSHPGLFPFDIDAGGLTYECSSIEVAATDTFGRTVADGWGAADSGQTYTLTGGTAPDDYDVTGGFGEHSLTSVNVFRHSLLDLGSSDQDITVDTEINVSTPTGGSAQSWVAARLTDTSNYYVAILSVTTAGLVDLNLYRNVAGSLTQLIPAPVIVGSGHSAGDFWSIRLRAVGSRVQAMAWRSTELPPANWRAEATDTALTTGNLIGLISRLDAGNSDALPVTVSWTNLRSDAPLNFSVTRLADDKPYAAGEPITATGTGVYGF